MKSIFFPFEQIVKIFTNLQSKKVVIIIEALLFIVICLNCYGSPFFYIFLLFSIASILIYLFYKKSIAIFGITFVLFFGIVYNFITKYYNENLNILSYVNYERLHPLSKSERVNLYSAERPGNYSAIAESVQRSDTAYFKMGFPESSGGYENPNRVLLDSRGIGFVQEDMYKDEDKIKEQINYVTPLYMEKLHIIYNKKSKPFARIREEYLSLGYNDEVLRAAIRESRIAVGKTGSATKILSSIVLGEISKTKPSIRVKKITNDSLSGALNGIANSKYDVVFFMAGQPVGKIMELLRSKQYGLIGIEPSLIDAINNTHKSNYRYANFSSKNNASYREDLNQVPTLGSYCYLIANKKVEPYLLERFVDILDNQIRVQPLSIDFFNFKDTYAKEYREKRNKTISDFLIALVTGVTIGTLILAFIFAFISSYYHDGFSNSLARIVKNIPDESIPNNEISNDKDNYAQKRHEDLTVFIKSLEANEVSKEEMQNKRSNFDEYYRENDYETNKSLYFTSPYVKFFQKSLIDEQIVMGLSGLVDLRQEVSDGLNKGKINIEHFNELQSRIDDIMEKLRKCLFLRLNELFNREEKYGGISREDEQLKKLLTKYVTSSYLSFDDFKRLYS